MHNFKKALKTVFLFSLLVTAMISAICAPYFYGEYYYYQDGYVRDDMAGKLDLLICGSSEALRGISPEILDQSLGCTSYNLSSPLMPLKTRYFFLKKEIERNPVDTVVLDLSINTLSLDWSKRNIEGQCYAVGRLPNPIDRLKYIITNIPYDQTMEFIYDSMNRGLTSFSALETGRVSRGSNPCYTSKGFRPLSAKPIAATTPDQYNKSNISTAIVQENLEYLEKILELCTKKDIDVIIISTPHTESSLLRYRSLDDINDTFTAISDKWDFPYYNFNLYRGRHAIFQDDTDYYDDSHLSTSGAEEMSVLLSETITAHKNGIDISDHFYISFQEMINLELLPYVS